MNPRRRRRLRTQRKAQICPDAEVRAVVEQGHGATFGTRMALDHARFVAHALSCFATAARLRARNGVTAKGLESLAQQASRWIALDDQPAWKPGKCAAAPSQAMRVPTTLWARG